MEGFAAAQVFGSVILVGVCILFTKLCDAMWVKPRRIRSTLWRQGIRGPKPSFLYGNIQEMKNIQSVLVNDQASQPAVSHNTWVKSIFPYLHLWAQKYGSIYMYSTGNKQHLYIGQPELLKELNLHKSLDLGKPTYLSKSMESMLGDGIIRANGPYWAYQRKLIAPEFFLHKAKHMLGLMEESVIAMIRTWLSQVEINGGVADITVDKDLKRVSADIISKACFGNSYSQGKQIFAKLEVLQGVMSKPSILFGLANFRFLPTESNRKMWTLQKEIETLILDVVKARIEEVQSSSKSRKDLLETLLESATNSEDHLHTRDADRFIVDNCKNIYFAGHETTALTASWSLMLLALYPEWQERIRAEIFDICGDDRDCFQDLDKLRQLKSLTMVIQETLRLYGPAIITSREAFADLRVGDLTVPKGTIIWISVMALHRDPENWGPDADEFKPERFAGGVAEACKYPQSYIPFGFGSRLCVGQTFAMLELKILLRSILSNFSFSLSPEYRHSPVYKMLLAPQHGIRLLARRLQRENVMTQT
ncbi:hypothetical protein P3X46_005151 [Hevea brasiliensis]|uniref:Cytochrome P450 n=1 Tax=Hevea brasiliensis TaxID=3981 RepID=A0ABQ9MYY4_HEVBR|nr:cytochrome P450 714C2 [Hevea brasiliensis]KAJ9185524.1 hypothetical protein P3X46_005151 [Hevea brasiliensis]